ncbi:MAG: divergent polysaccharide deacetylase family protein, partial [Pseudomonadota bacterium]
PGQGLDGLDAPLSIAVRPDAPDVGTLMSDYREAGQEVLIHGAGLPRNPLPQDVEVTLGTRLSQLDQVVALLDLEEGGISRDREVLEQALGVLSDGGHGLLLWDQGLNSAFGIASRIGHPAALVPRKVAGTDGRAVARALDRAAFDAGRSGSGGILAIEATGPALEALRSWLETSRAEQVALAPVSALLRPSVP